MADRMIDVITPDGDEAQMSEQEFLSGDWESKGYFRPYRGGSDAISGGEALARGAAQGGTFMLADEGAGVLGAIGDKFPGLRKLGQMLLTADPAKAERIWQAEAKQARPEPLSDLYVENRDDYRAKDKIASETHPWLYNTGLVGGGMASTAVAPWLAPTRAAPGAAATGKFGNAIGNALKVGAGGTIAGAGASEADTVGGVAKDAATTGLVSTAAGAASEAVAPWLERGAQNAKDAASRLWFRQAGAGTGDIRAVGIPESAAVGRELRDMGIVGPFSTPRKVWERALQRQEEVHPEMTAIPTKLDAGVRAAGHAGDPAVSFDLHGHAVGVRRDIIDPNKRKTIPWEGAAGKLQDEVDHQIKNAQYPNGTNDLAVALENYRRPLGRDIDFAADDSPSRHLNTLRKQLYGKINEDLSPKIEAAANLVGDPDAAARWDELNRIYHVLEQGKDAAFSGATRQSGNPISNMTGNVAGVHALSRGDIMGAAKVGGALGAARVFGTGALAEGADLASGAMTGLASKGPGAIPPWLADYLATRAGEQK